MNSSQRRSHVLDRAGLLSLAAALAVATGVLWPAGASLWAQQPDGYQVYALRNTQAEQVRGAIVPLVPPGTEVLADRKGNRILVRGSAEAQQIAQRALQSLDAPLAGPAPMASAGSQPILRTYSCPPGNAGAVAEGLQGEFGRTPGVRVVSDPRTSQVLVLAPPEIQTMVAARLGDRAAPSRAAAVGDPSPAPASPAGPARRNAYAQQVQLRNATARALEASLASVFGDRLIPAAAQAPGTAAYRVRLSDGGEIGLSVDRGANCVTYTGSGLAAASFGQLLQTLDSPAPAADQATRLVPLRTTRTADARRTVDAIRITNAGRQRPLPDGPATDSKEMPLATQIFRPGPKIDQQVAAVAGETRPRRTAPGAPARPGAPRAPGGQEGGGLIGPVQIEYLEGLDILIIRGNARDVRQVTEIIQQIEKLSAETEPAIEVYPLQNADSSAVATLVTDLYTEVYLPRQGPVTIVALLKPNALLLVGRKENVARVQAMIKQLDVPVAPESQFQVFRLKHAAAATVQAMIDGFYADRGGGLAPVVQTTSDIRSNSLIVHASPRDMAEVAAMIARVDVSEIPAVNELRVFKLTNTMASDLAQTLTDAIQSQDVTAQAGAPGAAGGPGAPGAAATRPGTVGPAAPGAARPAGTAGAAGTPGAAGAAGPRSNMLQFVTVNAQGQERQLNSGILTGVRISYDLRANTLIVNAPKESMPLIEALIKELDQPPSVRADIKVFQIYNADATALVSMLGSFFGVATTAAPTAGMPAAGGMGAGAYGGAGMPNYQSAATASESTLVPLRFAADARTNSIIASGIPSDLLVVEAILTRLDAADVRNRISTVYRLRNAPANDVANAINNFLRSELQVLTAQAGIMGMGMGMGMGAGGMTGGLLSPFEQIEHQVVVVAEPVSNSLIVAATPKYFEDIRKIVEDLDRRPPMVIIQVLLAEVDLTDNDEFGVELGLQDGLLFNRGIVNGNGVGGGTGSGNPGFLFNSQTLGNDNSPTALANAANVATQGLTNLGVGRQNSQLGFGGLVLQASSESVSVLLRALRARQRVDILARPQIQTLDNQTAYIQVGETVGIITGATVSTFGQTNTVTQQPVGIILGVTPRVSPDGVVVMEIDAVRSQLGPASEGTPVFVENGLVVNEPPILQTLAQSTLSATDGQTVVLGGLISRQITTVHNEVPYLADVPLLGHLFRFDTKTAAKTELLIVMTPHVIRTEEDAEAAKRIEAARMHWCLADVIEVAGEESGLRGRRDEWPDAETKVIYPDGDPRANHGPAAAGHAPRPVPVPPEAVPTPPPTPVPPQSPGTRGGKAAPAPGNIKPTAYGAPAPGEEGPAPPNVQAYYQEPSSWSPPPGSSRRSDD